MRRLDRKEVARVSSLSEHCLQHSNKWTGCMFGQRHFTSTRTDHSHESGRVVKTRQAQIDEARKERAQQVGYRTQLSRSTRKELAIFPSSSCMRACEGGQEEEKSARGVQDSLLKKEEYLIPWLSMHKSLRKTLRSMMANELTCRGRQGRRERRNQL